MRLRLRMSLPLIAAALLVSPVSAADSNPFGQAKKPYSADSRMSADGHVMDARVFVDGPRERRETRMQGMTQVMIIDRAKRTAVMLMPERKFAMNTDFAKAEGKRDPKNMRWTVTAVGEETVNGVRATKRRVEGVGQGGDRVSGFVWSTGDAIVVRSELDVTQRGRTSKFRQDLSNLKIGPQGPDLFRVPSDYQTMDRPAMPPGMPAIPGQPPRR